MMPSLNARPSAKFYRSDGVASITDYDCAEYTHSAVAAFVASNMADVGFGVETIVRRFDPDFISLAGENYIFVCKNSALRQNLLKSVCAVMQSVPFRHAVDTLAEYDGSMSGERVSFEEILAVKPEDGLPAIGSLLYREFMDGL